MDLIERKLYDIVQYNADSLKNEDNKNEELKFFSNLEKVSGLYFNFNSREHLF